MKSVRITLQPTSEGKIFLLFPSVEAIFTWNSEVMTDPTIVNYIQDLEKVDLLPGDFAEVEWTGCEYSYYENTYLKMNYVRIARSRKAQKGDSRLVTLYSGFIVDSILRLQNYETEDVIVEKVEEKDLKLDFKKLFKDEILRLHMSKIDLTHNDYRCSSLARG